MDENLIALIQSYMPEAQIEHASQIKGSYKIRLPKPANEMDGYEALRTALKEFGVKPNCIVCHKRNTTFRYFDNNSSKVLQVRYKCLECHAHFTLGGKQYSKDRSSIAKDHINIVDQTRKSKNIIEEDESEVEVAEKKRLIPSALETIDSGSGNVDYLYPLLGHQSRADQYPGVVVFQQQHEKQLGEFQQLPTHGTQYLHPPTPPTQNNLLQGFSSSAITGINTTNYTSNTELFYSSFQNNKNELSPQQLLMHSKVATAAETSTSYDLYAVGPTLNDPNFNDHLYNNDVQWKKSQRTEQRTGQSSINEHINASDELNALLDRPGRECSEEPSRIGNVASDSFDRQRTEQRTDETCINEDINASEELNALLNSPGRECPEDICTWLKNID